MTQAGGSSNINGILYQILGTLDWAANLLLKNVEIENDDISSAFLIIEPLGGGGDVRIQTSSRRIVEQLKSKSDHGAWSLNKVIEDVIPDLFSAVDVDNLNDDSEYFFVTEGHRGRWEIAQEFFRSLSRKVPDDPLDALDDIEYMNCFIGDDRTCTRRQLFLKIASQVRTREQCASEPKEVTYKKLWHLLSRFEMKESIDIRILQARINNYLLGVVEYREDVDKKRHELCGLILDYASKGEIRIAPKELLRKSGLSGESFRNLQSIKRNLHREFEGALHLKKYDYEKYVRKAIDWPEEFPLLILAGESGQGKTWRLARIAYEIFGGEGLAVFTNAQGDADKDLVIAADIIWKTGLNQDRSLTLDRIVSRRRETVPGAQEPWLTICIDDIQSTSEARNLVDKSWTDLGTRLALTTSLSIGRALNHQFPDVVHLIEIEDFTSSELRDYLHVNQREWGSIPADVRKTLHRPLLASLFCQITEDPAWEPVNEYELYERYWLRLKRDQTQPDFPDDVMRVRRLVLTIFEPGTSYPWTYETLQKLGMSNDTRARVEAVGWLQCLENGDVQMWHDRLLNWAVAEALVEARRTGLITTDELGDKLAACLSSKSEYSGKSLGYVPMDVLWLVSDSARNLVSEVPQLIHSLERAAHSLSLSTLYEGLLPTLGERIIPSITERLQAKLDDHYYVMSMANALLKIGEVSRANVTQTALTLLDEDHPSSHEVAMKILSRYPSREAIDRLWKIYKNNSHELMDKENTMRYWAYELSVAALGACIKLNPEWLRKKIVESDPQFEPVWELAYQVANLGETVGAKLWREVKEIMFAKTPDNKRRGLIKCIGRYGDKEEISRLEIWLKAKDDFASLSAFAALSELDANTALAHISNISTRDIVLGRGWWLAKLLLREPEKTRMKIRELMKARLDEIWEIADIYQGNEDEMDVTTLDFLLDALDKEIKTHFTALTSGKSHRMYRKLYLLSAANRYELLTRYEGRENSELERNLVAIASAWEDHPSMGHELKLLRLIVLKIGGLGITELVNCELAHQNYHARMRGLEWALVRPDETTRELLRNIAKSDHLVGNPPSPYEQGIAMQCLALLREDDALVESILLWGTDIPANLFDFRVDQPPMSDVSLGKVRPILERQEDQCLVNAVLAVGISGRRDFVPLIHEILASSPEGSELARMALIALEKLGDKSSELIERAGRELISKENQLAAGNALLRVGNPQALDILKNYSVSKALLTDRYDINLAFFLWRTLHDPRLLDGITWRLIKHYLFISEYLEDLGELISPDVQELLWEASFPEKGSIWYVGQSVDAIRGLAKSDSESAFRAALSHLERFEKDRELLPDLLVDLDAKRAVPILCEQMLRERQTLAKWAIGRSLRRVQGESQDAISIKISEILNSPDQTARIAAVDLIGWQGPTYFDDTLHKLAYYDISDKVREAAIVALKRQRNEREVQQLMASFKTSNDCRKWSLLQSILSIGDPILLKTKSDPIWLANILDDAAKPLVDYCIETLKKRIEEIKKEAGKEDKKNG
ncbi:MAG: hypothetical protein LUQ38_07340 [Methanotrichaceae archaeon]|nr:hypothetical protein [Methanotrichaceae archaeon]